MQIIKYNNEFLDIKCKKYDEVMVGSLACKGCEHNKGINKDGVGCIQCNFDEHVVGDRDIICWSCNQYQEKLVCVSKDEAIECYFDDIEKGEEPDTVKVYGFARQEINEDGIGVLEYFLEYLDENFGDPDGDWTEMTDSMKKAAQVFVDAIISEYEVFTCDCVYEEEVDLKKWLKKE